MRATTTNQSLEKIQAAVAAHGYGHAEKEGLLAEIKALFLTDKHFDLLEQNVMRGLKHIFGV